MEDPNNTRLFSQVSLYEIAIKQSIGKLPNFKSSITEIYLQGLKDNFTFLAIQNNHLDQYGSVPLFDNHRDPFDRLLIAAAIAEHAAIITIDSKFQLYSDLIEIIW